MKATGWLRAMFSGPLAVVLLLVTAHALDAQDIREDLDYLGTGHVRSVLDGDTIALADGSQVRLVGIMAPKQSFGRDDVPEQPFAREAATALEELALDRDVELYAGGATPDRHGRMLAHVFTLEGVWIQGVLLDGGLARTYSFQDNRALVPVMLERESAARNLGLGLWSDPSFQIRDAAMPGLVPVDSFELVEGTVMEAAEYDRRIYLNFGEDWRQDMTVTVSPNNRRTFRDSGFDFSELEGKLVRVRGWTQWYNGPVIEIDHPEQIEVLE